MSHNSNTPHEDETSPVVPVIFVPYLIHTDSQPFCLDLTCPCHEDTTLLAPVIADYTNGLLTPNEATRITQGKKLSKGWTNR